MRIAPFSVTPMVLHEMCFLETASADLQFLRTASGVHVYKIPSPDDYFCIRIMLYGNCIMYRNVNNRISNWLLSLIIQSTKFKHVILSSCIDESIFYTMSIF